MSGRGAAPRLRSAAVAAGAALLVAAPAAAQEDPFNDWLNRRIDQLVTAQLDKRQNTKQTEAPKASANSTALVDQSSASDLIGLALGLAGLGARSGSPEEVSSAAATVSAYAVYAGVRGIDPLAPENYNRYGAWRRLFLTLGYDIEKLSGDDESERIAILGGKLLIYNARDATHPSQQRRIGRLRDALFASGQMFGSLGDQIADFLFESTAATFDIRPADDTREALDEALVAFENQVLGDSVALARAISKAGKKRVDALILANLNAFISVEQTARATVDSIRRSPQISLAVLSKLRGEGADEYAAELVVDYGLSSTVSFTGNAAFNLRDEPSGADSQGGSAAFELALQLGPEALSGRQPLRISAAGNGKWLSGVRPTWMLQTKLMLPVWEGVDLPLSLTYANRTELIEESQIIGQIGFTLDTAQLIDALFP